MSDTIYGPADFYAISLSNGDVDDGVRQAVVDLLGNDAITVVDLLVVRKGEDGTVDAGELAEGVVPGVDELGETGAQLASEEDVEAVAELLEPGSAALVAVIEHTWARGLVEALGKAGAEVVLAERIPAEVVNASADSLG
ncbi:hypothetical protein GCM10025864_10430 [Luteimicrobium album]|uniref:DUF1269 domain-containing protein n=1 Tax=Luteimicrobium album TaxID=1054550 RepID=A0ABQ6I0G9_9MICO|nr:DUF6325 family protein [Luteimicrobium album]GMA23284.1 hypothetical protein GCM10025864_10430 [Luteimicrobium album]